ncbi:MAG: hypothetical protein NTW15_00325 [Burkholderiales bacterium]|nr:hypothetical protein [Burkholderiales bacterium]
MARASQPAVRLGVAGEAGARGVQHQVLPREAVLAAARLAIEQLDAMPPE